MEIDEIILKDCRGHPMTDDERNKLTFWLNESESNRKLFAQIKISFISPSESPYLKQEVWNRVISRLKEGEPVHATAFHFASWRKAVAVIAILVSAGIFVYQMTFDTGQGLTEIQEVNMIEKVSLPGEKVTLTLPDGSKVKLNAGSSLIVPDRFTGAIREVSLKGEAKFDVTRDPEMPFVIHTGDVNVKVLGTSFNVRSYPEDSITTVAVASGKVMVFDDRSEQPLLPGEKVAYNHLDHILTRQDFNWEDEFGWENNILIFREVYFSEIVQILERWYGVRITIRSSLQKSHQKFSGRYKEASLHSVLEGLSYVYNFEYAIQEKEVTIK